MESCGDDALELEGTRDVGEVRVFENFIGNCLVAVAPGQESPSFSGPLYVFRNVVVSLQDPPSTGPRASTGGTAAAASATSTSSSSTPATPSSTTTPWCS